MTYDPWLVEDESYRLTPTELRIELAEIEKEIAWNERRLENLVWGDDDRKQTEDMVADLRRERQRLLAVLNG
jgi:hypothetical protein